MTLLIPITHQEYRRIQLIVGESDDPGDNPIARLIDIAQAASGIPDPASAPALPDAPDPSGTLDPDETPDQTSPDPPGATRTSIRQTILAFIATQRRQVTSTEIYQHVRHHMDPPLNDRDLERQSKNTPRWRKMTHAARLDLVRNSLIVPGTQPNTWRYAGVAAGEPEPDPIPEDNPPPQNTDDGPAGEPHTPQDQYKLPILTFLHQRGGQADSQEVVAHLEQAMSHRFNQADRQPTPKGEPRWRAIVHNARLQLARNNLLRQDSPAGLWELTQQGHDLLESQPDPGGQ